MCLLSGICTVQGFVSNCQIKGDAHTFPCSLPIINVAFFLCVFLGSGGVQGERAGDVFVLLPTSSSFDFFQFLSRGLCVPVAQS